MNTAKLRAAEKILSEEGFHIEEDNGYKIQALVAILNALPELIETYEMSKLSKRGNKTV